MLPWKPATVYVILCNIYGSIDEYGFHIQIYWIYTSVILYMKRLERSILHKNPMEIKVHYLVNFQDVVAMGTLIFTIIIVDCDNISYTSNYIQV